MTGPAYREWAVAPALGVFVACTWAARQGDDGAPHVAAVLPDACIDLVWDGARLFVAGPDTGPVPVTPRAGGIFAGVRFRPGAAPAVLGVPAPELLDRRVDAADILGAAVAAELADRLYACASPGAAAALLGEAAARLVARADRPDPVVAALVAGGAEAPPVSDRAVRRRCTAAVGYGPKTLDRVLRFQRFLNLAAVTPVRPLAHLAADAGYADQSHLTRECGRLAGTTPARLLPRPTRSRTAPPSRRRTGP